MTEIKLEKRYPHSRTEDITDAFMRGYQQGKEDEHRWWSNHCANCKDAEQTEPSLEQFRVGLEYHTDAMHFGKAKGESITTDKTEQTEPQQVTGKLQASKTEPQTDCAWK